MLDAPIFVDMKPARVRAIADDLIAASDQVAVVSPPSESGDFTFTDAYAVAGLLHERRVRAGRVPAGVKLGFTNRVVWDELGLDAPFWAYMYRDTVDRTPRVSTAELVQPKIEPEIVVGLKECLGVARRVLKSRRLSGGRQSESR